MMRSFFKNIFLSCLVTGTSFASNADYQELGFYTFGQKSWEDANIGEGDFYETMFDSPFESPRQPSQSKVGCMAYNDSTLSGLNMCGNKHAIEDSQEDSSDYDTDQEDEKRLRAELIDRIKLIEDNEEPIDYSSEGISKAFFNLERAQGLFYRTPHELTLTYALEYCEVYFDVLNKFLQSRQPERDLENDLLLKATQVYMALNNTAVSFAKGKTTEETSPRSIHGDTHQNREKSIQRARAHQTRSADFIYTQGIHSEVAEEKQEKIRIATAFSKTRPLSQYFIDNKTACFWVYGHLYHPISSALPLRDNSEDWKIFDTIHRYQGRLLEFFYKTERLLMNKTFESGLGIEDPCVKLWRESGADAQFIEGFFQTWDTAFITYLSHVLVEDEKKHPNFQKMPLFLTVNKITPPVSDPMISAEEVEEVNILSVNEIISPSESDHGVLESFKEFMVHDFPVVRKKEEKNLTVSSDEYALSSFVSPQGSSVFEQRIHLNSSVQ